MEHEPKQMIVKDGLTQIAFVDEDGDTIQTMQSNVIPRIGEFIRFQGNRRYEVFRIKWNISPGHTFLQIILK